MRDSVSIQERVLERLTFAVNCHFSDRDLHCENVQVETMLSAATMEMVVKLRAEIYGEHKNHREFYEHPSTWWQMFRAKFFPRFWLKRWPVKMKIIRFQVNHTFLYPEFKPVRMMQYIPVYETKLESIE